MKRHIILCFAFAILCSFAYGDDYYIAPDGNDANPGTLERPLATIEQSQKLWRNAPAAKEIRVFYRGGCYEFVNTVTFDDSDRKVPITIAAYKNEKPLLQGSQKIDGWKPSQRFPGAIETQLTKRQLDAFPLPGQLFSDGKRLVRARHPDRDESNPRQKGFLFVKGTFVPPFEYPGRLIGSLVMPPVPGTSITWNFDGVVVPGEYRVWFRYATNTKLRQLPHGQTNFDGRWSLQVNNGRPIKMQNLPDTNTPEIVHAHGGWANCATVTLRKGENTITWINDAGDLVGFGGMALAIDPEWKPAKDMKIRQFPMTDDKPIIHLAASNFNSSYIKKSKWTISVYIGTKDAFRFVPGNLKENWCGPEVEMHIFPGGLGSCHAYMEIAQVDKIDSRQNIVWLADLPWKKTISEADANNAGAIANGHETDLVSPFEIGARYYLENHPDFLNAKGEWYLDRKSGIVYLYPLDGNKTDIRMDNTATLFRVLGKNGNSSPTLTLRGLTITETAHTRDDGHIGYQTGTRGVIEMSNTDHVAIQQCDFSNIGRYAVRFVDCRESLVDHCSIMHSCDGGIVGIRSSDLKITNNRIKYIGEEYKHIGAVMLSGRNSASCDRCLIAHNEIAQSSRYAFTLSSVGSENVIEFNDITDTNLETADTGAINFVENSRNSKSAMNFIRNNRIRNSGGFYTMDDPVKEYWPIHSRGIYLDSFASGYTVENNYVSGTVIGGITYQGGKNLVSRNNILINGSKLQGIFSNFAQNSTNLVYERNIIVFDDPKAGLFGYPQTLTTDIMQADGNFYWCPNMAIGKSAAYKNWIERGFDKNATIADPLFAHPEKEDGQLRSDSPCLKKGFKQIDFSTLGPQ